MSRDDAYLLDMLEAARRALEYAADLTFETFSQNNRDQDAIIRRLEIVGEAARSVSEAYREDHPEIPWPAIVGMRHRLAHDYRRIDVDVVWETVQQKIPELIAQLERLVPPEEKP
jgi:uncharacterized protein with HEPN domain